VLCSGFLDRDAKDAVIAGAASPETVARALEQSQQGATMILDPTGAPVRGFTVDKATGEKKEKDFLQTEEGILYADMNLDACIEGKQYHDIVGGYQRLDVFDLTVDRTRHQPVNFVNEERELQKRSLEDGEDKALQ
jgi:predicted amidohydrolase